MRTCAPVDTQAQVIAILVEVLSMEGSAARFDSNTPLLGAIPELDSMAVLNVITTLEERFGFFVDDDDLDGEVFADVASLVAFVERYRRANGSS